jgi:hypothetical protein
MFVVDTHRKNAMGSGPSDTFLAHKAINLSDDLSGTEKRVAAAIIDHFNRRTGQCDASLDSIAKLLGISRRTVIRANGSLVQKGYFDNTRHGGNFHRNSYLPIWSRFRAKEMKWNERRKAASRSRFENAKVSPLQGQTCPLAGDADVTQTFPNNHLKKTSLAPRPENERLERNKAMPYKELSRENSREVSYTVARERFHVKSTSSRIAALDAAERRWATSFTTIYQNTPAVYAALIDKVDEELRNAATAREMKKPGSGLHCILEALRDHLPAQPTSSRPAAPVGAQSSGEQSSGESQT